MTEKTWPNLGVTTKPPKSEFMHGPIVAFLIDEVLGIHVYTAVVSFYKDPYDPESWDQRIIGEGKEYSFPECMQVVNNFLTYDLGYGGY